MRILVAVEFFAVFGTRASQLAIPFLVLVTGHSPLQASLAAAVELVPYVAIQILGGSFVLRAGIRRVCGIGNAVAATAATALALLSLGEANFTHILAASFVIGVFRGPADVAAQSLIPHVSAASGLSLMRTTSLVEGAGRVATVAGAPAASLLLAAAGSAAALGVVASTFLFSALATLAIPPPADTPSDATTGWRSTLDGLQFLRFNPPMRGIARAIFLINVADAAVVGFLILLWSDQTFGNSAPAGVLLAVLSATAIVGTTVLAAADGKIRRPRLVLVAAFLIAGLPRFIIMATSESIIAIIAVWALAGFAAGTINPIMGYFQFREIPENRLPQVLGTITGISWIGIPIGTLIAGILVEWVGVNTTLIVMGSLYLLASADILLNPSWRGLASETATSTRRGDEAVP